MASTKDRQRALERARYERVQAKIAKQRAATVRRRRIAVLSTVAVAVVSGGVLTAVLATASPASSKPAAAASASAAATPAATASAAVQPTASVAGCAAPSSSAPKSQTWKTEPTMTIDKTAAYTMTIKTNCGSIVARLDAEKAPHTVNSFSFLAAQGFFGNGYCHRLTTSGIFVLQCGDPTATATSGGTGGPGYSIPDENLTAFGTSASVTYPAGTLAMANSGANTGGSQFFLVYKDSPLAPSYTPFGTITTGLDILQKIAAAGATAAGDGNPMQKVQIDSLMVAKS